MRSIKIFILLPLCSNYPPHVSSTHYVHQSLKSNLSLPYIPQRFPPSPSTPLHLFLRVISKDYRDEKHGEHTPNHHHHPLSSLSLFLWGRNKRLRPWKSSEGKRAGKGQPIPLPLSTLPFLASQKPFERSLFASFPSTFQLDLHCTFPFLFSRPSQPPPSSLFDLCIFDLCLQQDVWNF